MKTLIVGTGVIGALNALILREHSEIHHYVRPHKLVEWHNKSIHCDILDERLPKKQRHTGSEYTFQCVTEASDSYDLIIVPVNSFQLRDALTELHRQAPSARYLIMTLNWHGAGEIDAILRPEQYIMGYAGGGGTYRGSTLWGNIGDDVLLGSVYSSQQPLLDEVRQLFERCGVKPEIPANILHALWIHNVGTAPFGMALQRHGDLQSLIGDRALVRTCFRAMRECYRLCERRGVHLVDFPETKMYAIPFPILYPLFKRNLNGEAAQRYTAHAAQALEEMQRNYHAMLDCARELGVSMPNMELLGS